MKKIKAGRAIIFLWISLFLACLGTARAANFPLPLKDLPASDAGGVSNYAAAYLLTVYTCTNSGDIKTFKGTFTPNTSNTKIAIHTDDGSDVYIDGQRVLAQRGVDTHFTNLASSFFYIGFTFNGGSQYCIEVDYSNVVHSTNDQDGVTLYSYNGGGGATTNILVRGTNMVCARSSIPLSADCADGPFGWRSSNTNVATVNSSGTVVGVSAGTATITVTNIITQTGSKVVTVADPGISPRTFLTPIGLTNTFILTNAFAGIPVTWTPAGTLSADTKSNQVAFSSAGSNILVTASQNGCPSYATGVVVAVASLAADVTNLCGGGQVIYTATSTPPGYESVLTWSGEGLSGTGAKRTNNYSTSGVKYVTNSCGTSMKQVSNVVYRTQITPKTQTTLADAASPALFTLTNSVGPTTWQISPAGASFAGPNTGDNVSINPGSAANTYTITAYASALPSCSDTATLQVVRVSVSSSSVSLCEGGSTTVSATVDPLSYLAQLTFDTVTNVASGIPNTVASISPASGSTNLTVTGVAAGNATLRVRLGNNTYFGPVLKVLRVQFPTNPWYVPEGWYANFSTTIVPPEDASEVTYISANPAVALASGSGTNVGVVGITNGVTQILARVGGSTCASKDVTVVRVSVTPSILNLCIGQSGAIAATTTPSLPVTFAVDDPTIAALTQNGTMATVTSLQPGITFVNTYIGGMSMNTWTAVRSVRITFQTTDFFVQQGRSSVLAVAVNPLMLAKLMTFAPTATNLASVSGSAPRLLVTGLSNGTTQVQAWIGTNQMCNPKNITTFNADLSGVTFSGTNYHAVLQDNGNGAYPTPHWTKTNSYPASYRRNTYVQVQASFTIVPNNLGNAVVISGDGPYPIRATNTISVGTLTATATYSTNALPNQVAILNPQTISWSLSLDGGTTFFPVGSSTNTIYVTLADPAAAVYHTVVHLGCLNAAGQTNAPTIVTNIYGEFTDRSVRRVNTSSDMTYYRTNNPAPQPDCWTTAGLLKFGDGRCGAWANFLVDSLRVQGITNAQILTVLPPALVSPAALQSALLTYLPPGQYTNAPNFYVKTWDFSDPNPFFPIDLDGVAGQGNRNPRSVFADHAIVLYNGAYFDPSYGTGPFASTIAWEDASLTGFGAYVTGTNGTALYKERLDPKGTQETTINP